MTIQIRKNHTKMSNTDSTASNHPYHKKHMYLVVQVNINDAILDKE